MNKVGASLTLPRLERDEVAFCVAQRTHKTLPAEVVQHVIDKTDGIPLYIEERSRNSWLITTPKRDW